MKKEVLFLICAFLFMSLTAIPGVQAVDGEKERVLIMKKKADVTGDGKEDTIYLIGTEYQENSLHFKDISLEIEETNGIKHRIEFDGGFEPNIALRDFNQDGVKDLFVTVETGGSGGISNHYLYTLKGATVTDLKTPEPLIIQGQLLNKYKAKITIENNHKTHKFNLKRRANEYEQTGLYHKGKLNEPTELMIGGYDLLKPIILKEGKMGLRGTQTISGAYHADVIGRVQSTWIYKDGAWVLLGTKVFEMDDERGQKAKDK